MKNVWKILKEYKKSEKHTKIVQESMKNMKIVQKTWEMYENMMNV